MSNQKIINGRQYSFGTLSATDAVAVEVAVARVIGEPLFKSFTASKDGGDQDAQAAGAAAIGLLAAKMDAKDLLQTMQTVFKCAIVDGKPINGDIDTHFTGRNRELWQAFIAALQFNFADFFPDGLLGSAREKLGL